MPKIITVRHLLDKLEVHNVKLISGKDGIDKQIAYINIQEFALKSERIKENGVLLTTFKSFLEPANIIEHLNWLKNREISAVGVHTVFIKEIPQEVINFSNVNNFPMFVIPEEISYQQIMQVYNELLMIDANDVRIKMEQVNIKMLRAAALDKDAQYIVSTMGKQLGLSVLNIDKTFNVKSFQLNTNFSISKLQRIAKEIMEQKETLNREISNYKFEDNYFKLFPIIDNKSFYGFLVICVEKELSLSDWSIINYGKTALLLDAVKRSSIEKYVKNRDMKIIESVLKPSKPEQMDFHDLSPHLKEANYLYLIESDDLVVLNNVYEDIYLIINKIDPASLLWIYDNQIICIVRYEISTDFLNKLDKRYENIFFGISEKSRNINVDSIQEKYEQAKIGIRVGEKRKNMVNQWKDLGLDKFLIALGQRNILQSSIYNLLEPLINHDETFDSELVNTLTVYLNNYFSLKRSAEELFVHKNTIKYRIAKIKELYKGVNFEDPETYLLFEIALRLYEMESKRSE